MSSKSSQTTNRGPASNRDAGARVPGQPRMGPQALRPRPVTLRPAAATGNQESEKEVRKRLMQGIPKARRWVIRNRIELTLPPEFSQATPSIQKEASPVQTKDREEADGVVTQSLGSNPRVPPGSENEIGFPTTLTHFNTPMIPHPRNILGAGRVDPFGNYPIRMSYDERCLLDQGESTYPTCQLH